MELAPKVLTARCVARSICEIVWSPALSVHADPSPRTMLKGLLPTGMGASTPPPPALSFTTAFP
jgi:hypothetical protein